MRENIERTDIDEELEPAISRVVGGEPEQRLAAYFEYKRRMNNQSSKTIEGKPFEKFEREKTEEELSLVKNIIEKMEDFVRSYGKEPVKVKPKHIHFLEEESFRKEYPDGAAFYFAPQQTVGVVDSGSHFINALRISHELLHFNSFQSVEIDKNSKANFRRSGLGTKVTGEQEEFFTQINEAMIEELTIRFERQYFDSIPQVKPEADFKRKYVEALLERYPETRENTLDLSYFRRRKNEQGKNILQFNVYTYEESRHNLRGLINDVFVKNADRFKSTEEVFNLFADAVLNGRLLPLARLLEETYGKGYFRELGDMTKKHSNK